MKLKIVRTVAALRRETRNWRSKDLACAVVPTMGALHGGHVKLVEAGLERADRVLVTIFVNPKQFGPQEDLGRYPRDEAGDVAKLAQAGVHLVYAPLPEEVYGAGFETTVSVAGPAKAGLEDKFRPHFFDGVATVVAKLFIQTGANFAMFGEKDYQQLKVVTRMARDLDIPIEVIGIPTMRETDGLAMASRNRYLSRAERQQAPAIHRLLEQAAEKIRQGHDPQIATRAAARSLTTLGFRVDYVTARHAETLAVPRVPDEPLRLLAAAWLGKTRLIDNVAA
jgi:pantoate--beta-alanine ligase